MQAAGGGQGAACSEAVDDAGLRSTCRRSMGACMVVVDESRGRPQRGATLPPGSRPPRPRDSPSWPPRQRQRLVCAATGRPAGGLSRASEADGAPVAAQACRARTYGGDGGRGGDGGGGNGSPAGLQALSPDSTPSRPQTGGCACSLQQRCVPAGAQLGASPSAACAMCTCAPVWGPDFGTVWPAPQDLSQRCCRC